MTLTDRTCEPCRGGVPPMDRTRAGEMLNQLPGWELVDDGKKLRRHFKFKNFSQATDFVNHVAEIANTEDHHPEIRFGYGFAEVETYTHKIGGLHENDFILAAKVSHIVEP